MSVAWAELHFPTVADLVAHLAQYDPAICDWAVGVTIHHTAVPTVAQWRGHASMEGMRRFYEGKGWDGAPHLYVAPDGIWQANPLNLPGIHAGICNRDHWGVEVVGNYDATPWQEPIRSLAEGAIVALYRWRGLRDANTLRGHRECLPNKSCPGNAIDMHERRAWLAAQLALTPSTPPSGAITPDSALLAAPRATPAQCSRAILARPHGAYTDADITDVIVPAYFHIAQAVGLDPLLAVAQLIHETGNLTSWWAARPRRNGAGIGVTGRSMDHRPAISVPGQMWAERDGRYYEGLSFTSWADAAVPAHVGRLLAYALRDDQANAGQRALIARALGYRPLPASYRGCAPTLRGLAGRWAVPGTTYPDQLAAIANAIRGM